MAMALRVGLQMDPIADIDIAGEYKLRLGTGSASARARAIFL